MLPVWRTVANTMKPFVVLMVLALVVLVAYVSTLNPEVDERNARLTQEQERLGASNRRLAAENEDLRAEIKRLRNGDAESVERARTLLGLVGPDELVYQLPTSASPPPTSGPNP
ncbi:MAG: septum formation initiator family protein [Myxococcales bacterium]|nr:septum formation initiator family protein [Myxococcales bacterium]